MSGTKLITCKCNHEFQDNLYGISKRIGNVNENGEKVKCTVCNNILTIKTTSKKS